ncbi:phosphonopyruvate decarboxylase BcpC [Methyloglobulus morosus KoM1]|uniref:Phosphonopyruvate decarboxylase BcpC n=1 Tax=Methyloglobulus morosus KoM1 TaxID=1116472 RepID=V5CBA1_9GAMM|nr:phosphonopyruvate decarboxylase [Methyloglobulus morosus]ESS74083.1 phosphonopyruvate decarboxylase BcpC [Methyloglobulus morosus KoM1]
MIDPEDFLDSLKKSDIRFVTGVPDSLLKDVCACITDNLPPTRHVIATNEGSAIGLAIGQYLVSGRPSLVYLQNSGLGNIVNPIASLADPEVYGIPMLLMIGWRGEVLSQGEQIHDEPQHVKQGKITVGQLDVLDIPYRIFDKETNVLNTVEELTDLALARSGPVAMLVRKHTFSAFKLRDSRNEQHLLTRESAIQFIIACLPESLPVVATTGMASRELFELRKAAVSGYQRDFLTVGGMGHASQIATGIALARSGKKVVCIDGDGAMLMHMGCLIISAGCPNILHIVINNGAHDSVGGQPTLALGLELKNIADSCGYGLAISTSTEEEIKNAIEVMLDANCSCFLEIICKRGSRADLGRPDRKPSVNKSEFMSFLKGGLGD